MGHKTTPSVLVTPAKPPLGREPAGRVLLLAHGAGAPMDSPFLESLAELIAARGIATVRFEFAYMAERRTTGKKRPPPRIDRLCDEYRHVMAALKASGTLPPGPLMIGGKSMGGRVASLVADALHADGAICGLVCLGYPFHPPRKPEKLRTAHLADLSCPTLIVQGEADPFGMRPEIEGYTLSPAIRLQWIGGGDHDLVPKAGSGVKKAHAREQAWAEAADAIAAFAAPL